MGWMGKLYACFHRNCCESCLCEQDLVREQLYALPTMQVGRYIRCSDVRYYRRALEKVRSKTEIPTGMYACRIQKYLCPKCGKKMVRLTIFLPVRDKEMVEQVLYYNDGEMDGFI